jgi:hypothetical protein
MTPVVLAQDQLVRATRTGAAVTPRRKTIALVIAALADAIQLGLFPIFAEGALSIPDDALDVVVAVVLLVTLGWRWRLVAAFALELAPGVALFPSWTAFVASIPAARVEAPSARQSFGA